jgi:DNA-binding beta-propeller fold protein YncE
LAAGLVLAATPARAAYEVWVTNQATDEVLVFADDGLNPAGRIALDAAGRPATLKPHMIAFSPDGKLAFVANVGARRQTSNVTVIDATTKKVIDHLPAGPGAHAVAVAPDAARAFVANAGGSSVTELVRGADGRFKPGRDLVIAPEPGAKASHPICLAFSRDGAKLYVSAAGAGDPTTSGFIAVLSVAQGVELARMRGLGNEVCGLVLTQDGGRIYFTAGGAVGKFGVLDTQTDRVIYQAATSGRDPHGLALSPGGNLVWIINRAAGHITVLNTTTSENFKNYFHIAHLPDLAAFAPNGLRLFVTLRGQPATPVEGGPGREPGLAVIDAKSGTVLRKLAIAGDPHGIAVRTQ